MLDRFTTTACLRCKKPLSALDQSVAIYLFAQTVALRPRRKSPAGKIVFCPRCAVATAMGPAPESALNLACYEALQKLVGTSPDMTEVAWQKLNSGLVTLLPPAIELVERELLPPHAVSGPVLRAG